VTTNSTLRRCRGNLVAVAPLGLVLVAAGCGSSGVAKDVGAGVDMITRAELTAGAANLQQWYQSHGTYAGANPGVPNVTLIRADGNSWCLQTSGAHQAGPDGEPSAGLC
jgi:hypothetical protein